MDDRPAKGAGAEAVSLPVGGPGLWDRVFVPAPLVVVGSVEPDGTVDLAPKHQATPIGFSSLFGFVCTERHRTHANIVRTGQFTVSFPRPDQAVSVGQAAAPRVGEAKPSLAALPTFPATGVDGALLEGAFLWLECELDRIVPDFDDRDLIVGRIVAAAAPPWAIRDPEIDDADLLHQHPPLVFLAPDRFGSVETSLSFPFPADFSR